MSKKHPMDCQAAQRLLALGAAAEHEPSFVPHAAGEFEGSFVLEPELGSEYAALREHLRGCPACRAEQRALADMEQLLDGAGAAGESDPTANLLARARLKLDSALDREAQRGGWARGWAWVGFHASRLRAAPGLAALLLLVGVGAGFWGGYRAGHTVRVAEEREIVLDPEQHPHPEVVADVSRIERVPSEQGTRLEIHYDLLTPAAMTGSVDDPSMRRLLIFGLENGLDPAVRAASIDLLAAGCRQLTPQATTQTCEGPALRGELVRTLLSDEDPRVRLVALDGLEPWVEGDTGVRDAVLHAVVGDRSEEVRMEGIRLLGPLEVDSAVRETLHAIAARDGDPMIRSVSSQVLSGAPQVQ